MAEGIAAALAAAVANALAVVLQASEARRAPRHEAMRASLLGRLARRPRWLAGTGLMVVGGGLQVLALALAPIAVVQPMLSTGQLVLLAVARFKLGERVGRAEILGSLAIVAGLSAVVAVAPRHTIIHTLSLRVAEPLGVIGAVAVVCYLVGRLHAPTRLPIVVGAGLAYSWADFASKLLANNASDGRWAQAALWVPGLLAFGALAFLEENTALGRSPAVTVAPVIAAVKVPLPVLMALWAGAEAWGSSALQIGVLLLGLALVASGAASLGRSETVARVSGAHERAAGGGKSGPPIVEDRAT